MSHFPIRVLLVDNHELARHGLANHIATHEDMTVVGLAADGEEALALCASTKPDVVVIDLHTPPMDSLSVTRDVVRYYPGTHVIVMTLFMDETKHQEVLAAGAYRYLLKGNPIRELLLAIRETQLQENASGPISGE